MHPHPAPHGVSINGLYPLNDTSEVQIKADRQFKLSFEVFPTKTEKAQRALLSELRLLSAYRPTFISVTYGAGGKSQAGTADTAKQIQKTLSTDVMAHLTLAAQSRDDVLATADRFRAAGVRQILALRGDQPHGAVTPSQKPFTDTVEMIRHLADRGWDNIRTSAYPDIHKEATDADSDFAWLLAKFDAGASEAVTQFFFDADNFFRLRDRLDRYGLANKLIPGILVFREIEKMIGFAKNCGVHIPARLHVELSRSRQTDVEEAHCLSILLDLLLRLSSQGVEQYHFYTLNKAQPLVTLLDLLDLPKQGICAVADRQPETCY